MVLVLDLIINAKILGSHLIYLYQLEDAVISLKNSNRAKKTYFP